MVTEYPQTAAEYRKQEAERKPKEEFQRHASRLLGGLAVLPLLAFFLMLAIGAVHGFVPAVPAIGYGTTVLLILGADALAVVTKKFRK